jgi:hypothetical protein
MDSIRRYSTESCQTITSHAIITDELYVGKSIGDYRWNCRRVYSVGNVSTGNVFFARVYPSVRPLVFRRCVFFSTEMGFTDDCYTDGRVLSVRPSGIISPTDFIPVTDGISPSVKLFNGVVNWLASFFFLIDFFQFHNSTLDLLKFKLHILFWFAF